MSWLSTFKLGLPGLELDVKGRVASPRFEIVGVENLQRNVAGDLKRTFLKHNVPTISLQLMALPMSVVATLTGLYHSRQVLNFLSNTAFSVDHQLETSSADDTVFLTKTGLTGITIVGVFLQADAANTGTNYFTGGSYDAASREITLGTPLPSANESVWVSYTYTGHRVFITRLSPTPYRGESQDLWQASLELTGA